jgi:ribonuclease HII
MGKRCSSRFEREARKCGWQRIAGLDEVGRGSLFGQVVAAAVILDPKRRIVGLDDSKKLPAERREVLALRIREYALAWAIAEVDARRIDAWNIYQASRQAMSEALRQLKISPDYLLLDAMQLDVLIEQKSLIHGDALSISIAAASIIAKVERDRQMLEWDKIYPQYGLAQQKAMPRPNISPPCARTAPRSTIDFLLPRCARLPAGLQERRRRRCRCPRSKIPDLPLRPEGQILAPP